MDKSEAIQDAAMQGFANITPANSVFANINARKPVWWFDIPVEKAMEGCYLLLFDGQNEMLHIMHATAAFFQANQNFLFRENVGGVDKFRVELSAVAANRFQDVRSGAGGVDFSALLVNNGQNG